MVMRPAQPTHRRHRTGLLAAPATARLGLLPRTYTVRAGDTLTMVVAGGGGLGDPRERDRDLVRRDVEEGYVSARSARDDYGLDIEVTA